MSVPDEREAYRGLLKGDQATFDRFFDEYFPRLYGFILTRVDDDTAAAQTLCQQTLVRGLARFSSYRGDAALFTWLCHIAGPLIDDWWRSTSRSALVARRLDLPVPATQSPLTRARAAFREVFATAAVRGDGGRKP